MPNRVLCRSFRNTIALAGRIDPCRIPLGQQRIQIQEDINIIAFSDNPSHRVLFKPKALLEIDLPVGGMLIVNTFEPAARILRESRHSHDIVIRIDNKRRRRILPRA